MGYIGGCAEGRSGAIAPTEQLWKQDLSFRGGGAKRSDDASQRALRTQLSINYECAAWLYGATRSTRARVRMQTRWNGMPSRGGRHIQSTIDGKARARIFS